MKHVFAFLCRNENFFIYQNLFPLSTKNARDDAMTTLQNHVSYY